MCVCLKLQMRPGDRWLERSGTWYYQTTKIWRRYKHDLSPNPDRYRIVREEIVAHVVCRLVARQHSLFWAGRKGSHSAVHKDHRSMNLPRYLFWGYPDVYRIMIRFHWAVVGWLLMRWVVNSNFQHCTLLPLSNSVAMLCRLAFWGWVLCLPFASLWAELFNGLRCKQWFYAIVQAGKLSRTMVIQRLLYI
jgi:hypothetical protein